MCKGKSCVLNHHVSFGFDYTFTEYTFSATTQYLEFEKTVRQIIYIYPFLKNHKTDFDFNKY